MKKILHIIIIGIFVLNGITTNAINQSHDNDIKEKNNPSSYTHTIFAEFATSTTCTHCKYAHGALKNIYAGSWHPFNYVTLVCNENTKAYYRAHNEYNAYGYPTVFFDGGLDVDVGASSIPTAQATYNASILNAGSREVPDINIQLFVDWLGNATMNITTTVENNQAVSYGANIRVYVTEIVSSMGWYDTAGQLYTFPFLEYAFNEQIQIDSDSLWQDSIIWDGHDYNDGYGNDFGNIQYGNIMIIATIYNNTWHQGYAYPPASNPFDAYYVDDTVAFRVGDNCPPFPPENPDPEDGEVEVDINADLSWTCSDPNPGDIITYDVYFGNSSSPTQVADNLSITHYDPGTLEYKTTYYWKINAWDNNGGYIEGDIWRFTTSENPNSPPNNPSIEGPTEGKTGKTYIYNFTSIDPNDDTLFYFIDWGDGSMEEWIGPYSSSYQVALTHTWVLENTYSIRCKVKDSHGAESDWETLDVTMPQNDIKSILEIYGLINQLLQRFPLLVKLFDIIKNF